MRQRSWALAAVVFAVVLAGTAAIGASIAKLPAYKFVRLDDYYPDEARREDIQGRAVAVFTIGANGKVEKAAFLTASPRHLLEGAVLHVLKNLRFSVPKDWQQTGAVEQQYRILVDFKLIPCEFGAECSLTADNAGRALILIQRTSF